jgi:hypothetical protein
MSRKSLFAVLFAIICVYTFDEKSGFGYKQTDTLDQETTDTKETVTEESAS